MYLLSFAAPSENGISFHLPSRKPCQSSLLLQSDSLEPRDEALHWSRVLQWPLDTSAYRCCFCRRNILLFLKKLKIVFQLSGPHPKPIKKRQTCSLWSVGSSILLILCMVHQGPLRAQVVKLFLTTDAGFLTSSIICKPVIDLSWLQVHVLS